MKRLGLSRFLKLLRLDFLGVHVKFGHRGFLGFIEVGIVHQPALHPAVAVLGGLGRLEIGVGRPFLLFLILM